MDGVETVSVKSNPDGEYLLLGPNGREQHITLLNGNSIQRTHDVLPQGRWEFTNTYKDGMEICQWKDWE